MSYDIFPHKRFLKVIEKWKYSGHKRLVRDAEHAVQLLERSDTHPEARSELHEQWKDHALTGGHTGIRELHLAKDVLLIYRRHEQEKIIELNDIISHEELLKRHAN